MCRPFSHRTRTFSETRTGVLQIIRDGISAVRGGLEREVVLERGDLVLSDRVADELGELLSDLERGEAGRRDVEVLALRLEERERELPEVLRGHTRHLCSPFSYTSISSLRPRPSSYVKSKVQYRVPPKGAGSFGLSEEQDPGLIWGTGGRLREAREGAYSETGLVHKGRASVPGLDLVPEDDLDLPVVLAAWGEEGPEHAIDSERELRGERADVVH